MIREELLKLNNLNVVVKMLWTPSHTGITGNENADSLAFSTISNENAPFVEIIPESDNKSSIKDRLMEKWQNIWSRHETQLKLLKPKIFSSLPLPQNRKEQVKCTRLRIGHTALTHGFILKGSPPTLCDICNVPLTVEHILCVCVKLSDLRADFNLGEELKTSLTVNFNNVILFLKAANIFHLI